MKNRCLLPLFNTMGRAQNKNRESESQERRLEDRFLLVNRDRISRVRNALTARQQALMDVLPLLFHLNHPLLPGYVSQDTPAGIADYTPSRVALSAAKRLSKSFTHERRMQREFVIKGLYLMGSPGTIAYSKASDLDVWLCYDGDLCDADIAKLTAKARLVEQCAASLGLEMHFFILDPARFRRGETLGLSDESSGSSQHYLLLDEFYRSGLMLAGLKPLWWCVPPEDDSRYHDYIKELKDARKLKAQDYIDFGPVAEIPAEEFFGAAVWQLYKSINSPYKSVMKLLLMEAYASEYPDIGLLSHRYKLHVTEDKIELDKLDPYVLMYQKVEEYLLARDDLSRLELLRRSFYLKTNIHLSRVEENKSALWQREMLRAMTSAWDWDDANLAHLDRRRSWKVGTAVDERRDLIKALQQSYAALSKFARRYARDTKITQSDLNVLGRKLYAAFEKKPGKIDILTRGICPNPTEPTLSLHQIHRSGSHAAWMLVAGTVLPEDLAKHTPLKRAASVFGILAWCHFNRVADKTTSWHLYTTANDTSVSEIKRVLAAMNERFPGGEVITDATLSLNKSPRISRACLVLNLGANPLSSRIQDGGVLTSNQTDAFQFGGQRINLIGSVDLTLMTSWEEVFTIHYEGPQAIVDTLVEYLQWAVVDDRDNDDAVPAYCFSNGYSLPIGQRSRDFFRSATTFFARHAGQGSCRYIVEIGNRFYAISMEDGKPSVVVYISYRSLLRSLERPSTRFRPLTFDTYCLNAGVLPAIYALNEPGQVQIFVGERGVKLDVYILDEVGALFVQRLDNGSLSDTFDHFTRFLDNVLNTAARRPAGITTQIYRIQTDSSAAVRILGDTRRREQDRGYLAIRVCADVDTNDKTLFTIFCEDREFSTDEHGGRLFLAVVEYVMLRRRSLKRYPIYITDLEFSTRFKIRNQVESHHTVHLLKYKKRIEYQLTNALNRYVTDLPIQAAV